MAGLQVKRWVPRPLKAKVRAALGRTGIGSQPVIERPTLPTLPTLPTRPTLEPVVEVVSAPDPMPPVVLALSAAEALRLPYLPTNGVVSDPDAEDLAFPDFAPRPDPTGELDLPPQERWTVAEEFLESGKRDADRMVEAVAAAGLELVEDTRVLDFGCGPGRVLRWLPHHVDGWGVDLDADRIAWCQSALSPPFRFATCGTYPHLPFADGSFDLVYAGSVFTHLSELADAWLLELLRISAPGAILYLTVHDQNSIAFCREKDPESMARALTGHPWPDATERRFQDWSDRLGTDLEGFTMGRGYLAQVFYDRDAIVGHWSRYAEVVEVIPGAFAFHQTAVVLRAAGGEQRSGA